MGKNEQLKLERRLMQAQQQTEDKIKREKQLFFIYGVLAGIAATALVGGVFLSSRNNPNVPGNLNLATGSATLAPIAVPNDIQLPTPSATPLL